MTIDAVSPRLTSEELTEIVGFFRAAPKDSFRFSFELCGSRKTCTPPPMDTDIDILVEISPPEQKTNHFPTLSDFVDGPVDFVGEFAKFAALHGFTLDANEHYQNLAENTFMSWKRGKLNLLVSASNIWCQRHRAATSVCRRLNLMHKPDRIAVFQAVLYGGISKI